MKNSQKTDARAMLDYYVMLTPFRKYQWSLPFFFIVDGFFIPDTACRFFFFFFLPAKCRKVKKKKKKKKKLSKYLLSIHLDELWSIYMLLSLTYVLSFSYSYRMGMVYFRTCICYLKKPIAKWNTTLLDIWSWKHVWCKF
jgi:uncharacterized protein with PQ loop repeat